MRFFQREILTSKGVSLIESLLVIVALSGIVLLLGNLPNAMNLINKSKNLSIAREIASKQIEEKRSVSFINLTNDTTSLNASTDSRIGSLPGGGGQVVVEDCPISICTHNENIKQLSVTITWKENSKDQSFSVKTFIGEGGLNQ